MVGAGEDGGEFSKSIKSTSSLLWEAMSAIFQGTRLLGRNRNEKVKRDLRQQIVNALKQSHPAGCYHTFACMLQVSSELQASLFFKSSYQNLSLKSARLFALHFKAIPVT